MAKGAREKIKLESSAGTGHFYTTSKNKRTTPAKLEIKKFDPVVRKHVMYKETKLKYVFAPATAGRTLLQARHWRAFLLCAPRRERA